ncbi:hypothetical protein BIW11_00215 [Tropilaelaps mercedesae]|uniref:Chitin-binding type-2 domain-containing protein n=1 Tax=Tropilaelaps mercedesae TaxID=418985 RepID=A0A1V9XZX6_9ACAR|nr:hypothetical protein BIW11_00215 [Tropilaelaps mercedesae]
MGVAAYPGWPTPASFEHLAATRGFLSLAAAQHSLSLPDGAQLLVGDTQSTFSCPDQYGYFADVDTDCRVFHVCNPVSHPNGLRVMQHFSFVCGNQTVFDQLSLSCAYPEDAIPCETARSFFYLNERVGQEDVDIHNENDISQAAPHVLRYAGNWAPTRERRPAPATAPSGPKTRTSLSSRNKVARHANRPSKLSPVNKDDRASRNDVSPPRAEVLNAIFPPPRKASAHKSKSKNAKVVTTRPAGETREDAPSRSPAAGSISLGSQTPPAPRAHLPVVPPPRPTPIPVNDASTKTTISRTHNPTVLATSSPPSPSTDGQTTFTVSTSDTTRLTPREPLWTFTASLPTEAPEMPTTIRLQTTTTNGPTTTGQLHSSTENELVSGRSTAGTATETPDVTGRDDRLVSTTVGPTAITEASARTTSLEDENTTNEETDPPSPTGTTAGFTDAPRSRQTPRRTSAKAKNSEALQAILSVGPRAEGATQTTSSGKKLRRRRVKTPSNVAK